MKKALLIIDHGSQKEEANEMLYEVAEILRGLKPGLIVEIAHMELAEPSIKQGLRACVEAGAKEIIAHPYMLSPGRHATSDIPRMIEEYARNFPGIKYSVTPPLGLHNKIGEVILERAGLD
jgi:sirohydrochlorin ferrochelatase